MAVNLINTTSPLSVATLRPLDANLVATNDTFTQFSPNNPDHYIEYTVSSVNGVFNITDSDYTNYKLTNLSSPDDSGLIIQEIDIDPVSDLQSKNFTTGEFNVIYNFFQLELNSSNQNPQFFVKEISSDRTEIRVISTDSTPNLALAAAVDAFKIKLYSFNFSSNSNPNSDENVPNSSTNNGVIDGFQQFYLNFGGNIILAANNIAVDTSKPQYEILINLYDAVPSQIQEKNTLWFVTALADTLSFNITFTPDPVLPSIDNGLSIKGPNFDLSIKDKINNSSNYLDYTTLLTTGLSTSYNQILSYLEDSGLNISIDYSDFSNFIHFSSAQQRIQNFYYKVQLIEQYNASILDLELTNSSSIDTEVSLIQDQVTNVIKNFDGFEYYLYYTSGSNAYPKGTTAPPYDPVSTVSAEGLAWYNEQTALALDYDQNNKDNLINTIPSYLAEDPQNAPYSTFVSMIGQHYDNIWLYYQDVTNRYNGDNRLNFGVSKDLVADALRSFGLKIYQNNFTTNNLYDAFIGYDIVPSASFSSSVDGNVYASSSYIVEYPDVGYFLDDIAYYPGDPNELITNFISASQAALFTPVDDINKEIYKRLYHNLPLLLKQKGTISGLRNLINIYGIPDSILRISEFGGRDKDTSTYDYFHETFNYSAQTGSASPLTIGSPWDLNNNWNALDDVPSTLQFRFKTNETPTSNTPFKQGIWYLSNGPIVSAIVLKYTGSGYNTSSYSYPDSGSNYSPEWQYAQLSLVPNIATAPNTSASVYLPFYDNNWWSVMVTRVGSNLVLYAGNKLEYNGYDGNQIGFLATASIAKGIAWTLAGSTSYFFDSNPALSNYDTFTGNLQEIRYWSTNQTLNSFKDFIMNPNSIDIANSEDEDYADRLAFRIPLGSDLNLNTSSFTGLNSIHPKISGSWIYGTTQSFASDSTLFISDGSIKFVPNNETFFLNSPIAGLKNRVTDKIQIVSSSYPSINLEYTQSGNTLSQYVNIQQQYPSQGSETPDVNALEVAFSPTNEIDDDIIASLGYFNIGEYIGDPRQVSSSATSYPDLNRIRDTYFQKYFASYNLYDYIRLIKFFDNSLFKMIKDFVPARTNLRSGVVIKQHLLERNKYPQPQVVGENVIYTGSIDIAFITGSTGGTFNEFNKLTTLNNYPFLAQKINFQVLGNTYKNYLSGSGASNIITFYPNSQVDWNEYGELITYFEGDIVLYTEGLDISGTDLVLKVSSSIQGNVFEQNIDSYWSLPITTHCSYGEKFSLWFRDNVSANNIAYANFGLQSVEYSQQTWLESVLGPTGSFQLLHNDQSEFYDGELPGTTIEVSNGELNEANIFKYPSTLEINYNIVFYKSSITSLNNFTNIQTSPNQGEIYLWYDTGSYINPAPINEK